MKNNHLLIATVISLYFIGYLSFRFNGNLIHYSSYYTDETGVKVTALHKISRGDYVGALQFEKSLISLVADSAYRPVCFIESLYWNIRTPKNEVWPYTARNL